MLNSPLDETNISSKDKNVVPDPREVEHHTVHKDGKVAGCAVVTTNYLVNKKREREDACPGRTDPTDDTEALKVSPKVAEDRGRSKGTK